MEALKADKARQVGTAVTVTFTPHVLVLAGEALRGTAVSPPSPVSGMDTWQCLPTVVCSDSGKEKTSVPDTNVLVSFCGCDRHHDLKQCRRRNGSLQFAGTAHHSGRSGKLGLEGLVPHTAHFQEAHSQPRKYSGSLEPLCKVSWGTEVSEEKTQGRDQGTGSSSLSSVSMDNRNWTAEGCCPREHHRGS